MSNTATRADYLSLAAKFEEARYGNGPGLGPADLAEIGLSHPESFTTKDGRKVKLSLGWEVFCAYVFETLSDEPVPGSMARGRGFRSQQCGAHVVKLLKKLAEED